jgi:hypothetical protein
VQYRSDLAGRAVIRAHGPIVGTRPRQGRGAAGKGLVFAAEGWWACNQGNDPSRGRSSATTAMWQSRWSSGRRNWPGTHMRGPGMPRSW